MDFIMRQLIWYKFYFALILSSSNNYLGNPTSSSPNYVISSKIIPNILERVVTNMEIVYGSDGVPIEYRYNETTFPEDKHLGSVPGCPKSIDGIPWIHFGKPERCYFAGVQGPCPEGEILTPKWGSTYGVCTSECKSNDETNQGPVFQNYGDLICVNNRRHNNNPNQMRNIAILRRAPFRRRRPRPGNNYQTVHQTKDMEGPCDWMPTVLRNAFRAVLQNDICDEDEQFSLKTLSCTKIVKPCFKVGK